MALDQTSSSINNTTPASSLFADTRPARAPRDVVLKRVARALNELNDRELREIGISRYQIGDIARGLAKRA